MNRGLKIRVCVECSTTYDPSSGQQKYCSISCGAAVRRRNNSVAIRGDIQCPFCLNLFSRKRTDQKYCSIACRDANFKLNNPDYHANWVKKPANRIKQKAYKDKIKAEVFSYYGNKCACCDLNDSRFLTIDHINNDGYAENTGNNLYSVVIREKFPDRFQLLCWNCNCAKNTNGGTCPHKD